MKKYRINRLFNPQSGNCFDVAMDHGFFGQYRHFKGIENIERAINVVVDADPDAIQLTIGQSHYLQSIPGKAKPALVLRTDIANAYGLKLANQLFSHMIEDPVGQAIRLDASCVVVNLIEVPDHAEVLDQCTKNILKLKPLTDMYSMPLMIEPLVFLPNHEKGGYMVDGDVDKIIPLARQAVELGADIIKADPTSDTSDYHRVVEVAGRIPILVRGGGKASTEEVLLRTQQLMSEGARGIVYGRNIIQHENPGAMTKALMAIVHSGMTAREAQMTHLS